MFRRWPAIIDYGLGRVKSADISTRNLVSVQRIGLDAREPNLIVAIQGLRKWPLTSGFKSTERWLPWIVLEPVEVDPCAAEFRRRRRKTLQAGAAGFPSARRRIISPPPPNIFPTSAAAVYIWVSVFNYCLNWIVAEAAKTTNQTELYSTVIHVNAGWEKCCRQSSFCC